MKTLFERHITYEEAEELIKNGTDVNQKDIRESTPLHECYNIDIIKLLIKHGAAVNSVNKFGHTPLYCHYDNYQIVELLIDHGADVNLRYDDGLTLLHIVQNSRTAELLIDHGAIINAVSNNGLTPLHLHLNENIIRLLISRGADVNKRNLFGETALHRAETLEKAQLLIENGADSNAENNIGQTPIFYTRDKTILKLLIAHGANINYKDISDSTPLSVAVYYGMATRIAFLIANGAVPYDLPVYKKYRYLFTNQQKHAFDSFELLTGSDNEFFNMCLAYQNNIKNNVKIDIKDMDIQ